MKQSFVDAFSRFPEYEFIWKFEAVSNETESIKLPTNVHTFGWVNQKGILGINFPHEAFLKFNI